MNKARKHRLKSVIIKTPYSMYYCYILDGDCIISSGSSLTKRGAKRTVSRMVAFWRQFYYCGKDTINYDGVCYHKELQHAITLGNQCSG